MARLLLIGPSDLVAELAALAAEGHEIITSTGTDDAFDIAIDLSIDARDEALTNLRGRGETLARARIIIVNGLTQTATAAAEALGSPGVLALSFLRGVTATAAHLELAAAMQCDRAVADDAAAILADVFARPVERVEDRVGLVSARILAMVINEGAFAVMEGVAGAADIDTAMKLGTSYPQGPLAWSDAIGHDTVVRILDALYDEYREERYRACVLLRQTARARRAFVAR